MEALKTGIKELPNMTQASVEHPAPGDIYDVVAGKLCKKSPHKNLKCEGIVCKI